MHTILGIYVIREQNQIEGEIKINIKKSFKGKLAIFIALLMVLQIITPVGIAIAEEVGKPEEIEEVIEPEDEVNLEGE